MNKVDPAVLAALKQSLHRDPQNGPLWQHYAELLELAGHETEAIAALRECLELNPADANQELKLAILLRKTGQNAEALIRLERLLEQGEDPATRLELSRVALARGDDDEARGHYRQVLNADASLADPELDKLLGPSEGQAGGSSEPVAEEDKQGATDGPAAERPTPDQRGTDAGDGQRLAGVSPEHPSAEEQIEALEWSGRIITFADVVGLSDVKTQIRLRIIAPFHQKEIYKAFSREAGGGLLLYGPPGCGKTFMARASAGELGARFVSVGINDILDRYWGESERLIHTLFVEARRRSPTVLFFDEFDALGASRGRSDSQFWRTLVDQLLQEMDGMEGRPGKILVFAATNMPWNVDPAFRRPGRFDRVLFIPPPDAEARAELLRRRLAELPGGKEIRLEGIIHRTHLFTGADINALCERAAEKPLARSLETGEVHPVTVADFDKVLGDMQSSALEWFATSRNYAQYANEAGQYDELAAYLKRIGRW